MDHIATSPPQLRTLQPAALHTFQHPQDDRGAAHAFAAAAAASGTYAVNPDDSGVLFQQPAFLTAVPDRAIRSQRDQLPPALSGLQSQHISPHQSNTTLFHFGSPQQDPHFAAPRVQIQPPPEAQDAAKSDGKIEGLKLVLDPPNLDQWRQRLFDVDQTIVMTEDQFQTYWPHVDNIYSHRSTQRYKRKPFVSHYWDCRLKGRPPGTPKSDDPNKKKRKRVARERDLCDVKIKITEYEPGSATPDNVGPLTEQPVPESAPLAPASNVPGQLQWPMSALHLTQPDPYSRRIYTIQRVNGNGANGKADGNPGPHKHDLEESDRIKKNSVIRHTLKNEKEKKKQQPQPDAKKTYHTKATGNALNTAKKHAAENELKLFGSCFCPFVQRVWISLVYKDIPYQYIEVDPYKKPQSLLEVNPRGLVPALRHGDWGCYESTVLMEYLEDLGVGRPLMPSDPKLRANSRLWSDHINRHFIPGFYRFLQEQDAEKQVRYAEDLKSEITKLVDAADKEGPFFLGKELSFVDVQMAPWVIRLNKVLKPYRAWPEPEAGSRWGKWLEAIEKDPHVQATTSTDDLYLDSYERYAENRPNTSQLANAVNSGRGLP
ncbi:Glutathione transferase [Lasiodiplodia theobromae]|uniref:Glutathione S-transferase omega-1 n=1 Tax=Lasiodiplodia theobromae TaxID=45133 RepID=A0A5N5DEG1_9PEZI|nr:Glutathione transferase [Lasiodiplodia theobromae]KAB2576081.1 Glutathione S-transferase omega-1 [Lasiodiplodia theobromae]KAF4534344.1 Glutathione transferase [Lasiodiplodia theobromae]